MVASLACTPHLAALKPPDAHYIPRKSPRKHPNQSRIQSGAVLLAAYTLSDAFTVPPLPKSWRPAVVVNAFMDEWEECRLTAECAVDGLERLYSSASARGPVRCDTERAFDADFLYDTDVMPICDTPVILPGVSSLYQPSPDYPLTQPCVISEFYCCYADALHTPPMTPTESVGAMTGSMGRFPPASQLRQVGYFRALLRSGNLMAWSAPTGVAFLCVAAYSQVAVVQYVDRFAQATP